MYEFYIDAFIPSKELAAWLKTQTLSPWQITELSFFSTFPLAKKKAALRSLLKEANAGKDANLTEQCRSFLIDPSAADALPAEDGIFP